eukprot:Ihof_evm4s181 gene=Ihof_evmTU4s181
MPLKYFRPTTPGLRHLVLVDRTELWNGNPYRPLTKALRKTGGRCRRTGRITVRHIGGGSKRRYRLIDFKREDENPCIVKRLEYDPNRTAWIALTQYATGRYSYILAPQGLKPGDIVSSGNGAAIQPGCTLPLKNIPLGTLVHNVELYPGKGGQMARAAGTSIQLVGQNGPNAVLKMCSKE